MEKKDNVMNKKNIDIECWVFKLISPKSHSDSEVPANYSIGFLSKLEIKPKTVQCFWSLESVPGGKKYETTGRIYLDCLHTSWGSPCYLDSLPGERYLPAVPSLPLDPVSDNVLNLQTKWHAKICKLQIIRILAKVFCSGFCYQISIETNNWLGVKLFRKINS